MTKLTTVSRVWGGKGRDQFINQKMDKPLLSKITQQCNEFMFEF